MDFGFHSQLLKMASQITSITIVCSTDYSGIKQRKPQSSASLAFVRGIHRWQVNSAHKRPVTRKMFPFDDVIMPFSIYVGSVGRPVPLVHIRCRKGGSIVWIGVVEWCFRNKVRWTTSVWFIYLCISLTRGGLMTYNDIDMDQHWLAIHPIAIS